MPIYKRGRVYWFHFEYNGTHYQRSTRQSNANIARQIEAAFRTQLAKGEVGIHERKPIPSLTSAMRSFLQWSENQHRAHPNTFIRYRTSSRTLLRLLRDLPLDQITPDRIEHYKAQRAREVRSRGKSKRSIRPATINRELACLKAMFNFAINSGCRIFNPVSRVKFLSEGNEQTRVLTYEEQAKYLEHASRDLKHVAVLMLETGMRPEEVYRIEAANVNLEAGFLTNPYGKTKAARRKITLTTTAASVLKERIAAPTSRYIFPCNTDPNKPLPKINGAHNRAIAAAGVKRFRLYDLRHTWATRAAMSGIDLVTLAALLGHSRIQMVLRYAHPTDDHQALAMKRLEQFNAAAQIAEFDRKAKQPLQLPLQ